MQYKSFIPRWECKGRSTKDLTSARLHWHSYKDLSPLWKRHGWLRSLVLIYLTVPVWLVIALDYKSNEPTKGNGQFLRHTSLWDYHSLLWCEIFRTGTNVISLKIFGEMTMQSGSTLVHITYPMVKLWHGTPRSARISTIMQGWAVVWNVTVIE